MRQLLILTALFTIGLSSSSSFAALPKKASALIMEAKAQSLSDQLVFPGRVRSRISAVAVSEIEGQVVRIDKSLGARVRKGDVIMTLQNTDPVYQYAPIKMRSPSDGFLTTIEVSAMARIDRGQKLFTITDPKNLVIEVEIPAHDLGSIQSGMKAEFKPDPLLPEKVPVVVEGLSPLVDFKSGTASAELKPVGKAENLRQGQLGQATFHANVRKAFLVPESALMFRDEKPFVRLIVDGKIQKKQVTLGRRMGDSFEVQEGLKSGDSIVQRVSRFVSDGEEVEVQKEEGGKN